MTDIMTQGKLEIARVTRSEDGTMLAVLAPRRNASGYAVPALAVANGCKLELWIDTERAILCASAFDAAQLSPQEWGNLFLNKTARGSDVVDIRAEWGTRGWTTAIVRKVQEHLPQPIACMVGHFAGKNRQRFDDALEASSSRNAPELLDYAVALRATPFFQSRAKLGYAVTELARARLPDEVWVRMYRSELSPAEIKEIRSFSPKTHAPAFVDAELDWVELPVGGAAEADGLM